MSPYVGLVGIGVFCFSIISDTSEMAGRSESQLLKSYAISQCIARGYSNSQVAEDATSASGGYLEFGNIPVERYGEAIALAEEALKKRYKASLARHFRL